MGDRFTGQVRRVLDLARDEADRFGEGRIEDRLVGAGVDEGARLHAVDVGLDDQEEVLALLDRHQRPGIAFG